MKSTILQGKSIPILDSHCKLIDDIDTDMIFHNAHLHITDVSKMGPFAFGNLVGWNEFPNRNDLSGSVLFVGANFGSGSSRAQAVDCFRALNVAAIIGVSFGGIYYRNAINTGFPVLVDPDLINHIDKISGDITIDLEKSCYTVAGTTYQLNKIPKVQLDIYHAGGLFKLTQS